MRFNFPFFHVLQTGQVAFPHAPGPHDVQRGVRQPGDDARIRQGSVGNAVHEDEVVMLLQFLH